jgi:hypothetical protein
MDNIDMLQKSGTIPLNRTLMDNLHIPTYIIIMYESSQIRIMCRHVGMHERLKTIFIDKLFTYLKRRRNKFTGGSRTKSILETYLHVHFALWGNDIRIRKKFLSLVFFLVLSTILSIFEGMASQVDVDIKFISIIK